MTFWILEDEPPALRRLSRMIAEACPSSTLAFSGDSIASGVRALEELPPPDVIFSDIHLADGLAFDIWEQNRYAGPLVFTTAYDQYALRAFRVNGMDYLLKPIDAGELAATLTRIEAAARPAIPPPDWSQIATLIRQQQPAFRERLLARRGDDWLPVRTADLRLIYSRDGLTFGLGTDAQRLLLTETLEQLTEELDPRRWFRINRSELVHVDAVVRAQPYFNHRLALTLRPAGEGEHLVSRARVRAFKTWLGG